MDNREMTPEELKAYLSDPLPVHYHGGNPEPHMTPRNMITVEAIRAKVLAYVRRLESDLAKERARVKLLVGEITKAHMCLGCAHVEGKCPYDCECSNCTDPCVCNTCDHSSHYTLKEV